MGQLRNIWVAQDQQTRYPARTGDQISGINNQKKPPQKCPVCSTGETYMGTLDPGQMDSQTANQ
eukprot:16350954-Heterocapsa_arctica.AAC.1